MRFLEETRKGRAKGYLVLIGRCVHQNGTWTVYRDAGDDRAYVRVLELDVIRGPESIEDTLASVDAHHVQGLIVRAGAPAEVRLGDEQWAATIAHPTEPVRSARHTACISGMVFARERYECLGAGVGKWDWPPTTRPHT